MNAEARVNLGPVSVGHSQVKWYIIIIYKYTTTTVCVLGDVDVGLTVLSVRCWADRCTWVSAL